jgi:Domain of unknown function (DUF4926)
MIKEHDQVVLTSDLAEGGMKAGDVGTVVHLHQHGEAYEVEFFTLNGKTAAIATVLSSQLRPVSPRDITHARTSEVA